MNSRKSKISRRTLKLKRNTRKKQNTRKNKKLIGGGNKDKRNHTELQTLLDSLSTMVRLSGNNSRDARIYFNDDGLVNITTELSELKGKLLNLTSNSREPILPTLAEFIDQGGEVIYDKSLEHDGSVVYGGDYNDEFEQFSDKAKTSKVLKNYLLGKGLIKAS